MAAVVEKFGVGLVFGKFYPLTKGHQHLIGTAAARCEKLFVAVSFREGEMIPQGVRAGWIRELFPAAEVVEQPADLPYFIEECASETEFYRIWTAELRRVCGGRSPDVIFTSENYGEVTAGHLGCAHVMVDRARAAVPICATKVRENPLASWDFLDPVVREYFVKVVCLIGPESTGKSTLAARLAERFGTVWQPEFAREYLGLRHCELADMELMARGQWERHAGYRKLANKVLIVDTDAITTAVFSRQYYGCVPAGVARAAAEMSAGVDLYLVMDVDVPWVADSSRDLGERWQREMMREQFLGELRGRGLRYAVISGNWEERLARAATAVEGVMAEGLRMIHGAAKVL